MSEQSSPRSDRVLKNSAGQSYLPRLPAQPNVDVKAANMSFISRFGDPAFAPEERLRDQTTVATTMLEKNSVGHPSSPIHDGVGCASSQPRPRILLVDDEYIYIALLADTLDTDYEIVYATDSATAIEIATNTKPDLVLLDVMMPDINGYEICTRLKEDDRTKDIPIIFVTSIGDVEAETRGLKLGAVDYITKPFSPGPVKARVSTHIKLQAAQERLTLLAATDGLTGLRNRAHFDKMLAYEYSRHARSGGELSLILLDVDYFKAFNDTYGHICGDDCLRKVAHAIAGAASRLTDVVARYGGEEFVLLLPETSLRGSLILAEKVRKCISDLGLPHRLSSEGHITASFGVSCSRISPLCVQSELVAEADIQLYTAKAGGRNRVASRATEDLKLER
jgi:diguanylate cyclase (GGDEF)-like protein